MAIEEAIECLDSIIGTYEILLGDGVNSDILSVDDIEAIKFAINVLTAIDDIKSEIKEEAGCAYADFEQYKVEYLGVDPEYVEDELPQDDFRYGMKRCLEIINKHIGKETG